MSNEKILGYIITGFSLFFFLGCWNPFSPEDEEPKSSINPPPFAIDTNPAWSPDGELIAFCFRDDGGIWLVNSSGENKRFLVTGFAPDWSPDGRKIAFNQGWNIFTITVDGDSLTQLTFDGLSVSPAWSPDGKKIAYSVLGEGIYIMDCNGNNKTYIIGGRDPDWSPDGNKIVYQAAPKTRDSEYQIWIANIDGSNSQQLTKLGNTCRYPQWSPDGTKIVFCAEGFEGYRAGQVLPALQVWVMNADGSRQRQLTKGSGENPNWSPDGTRIIYNQVNHEGGRIWIMNVDGTGKRQFTY